MPNGGEALTACLVTILTNPNIVVFGARGERQLIETLTLILQKTISGFCARVEDVVRSEDSRRQGVGRHKFGRSLGLQEECGCSGLLRGLYHQLMERVAHFTHRGETFNITVGISCDKQIIRFRLNAAQPVAPNFTASFPTKRIEVIDRHNSSVGNLPGTRMGASNSFGIGKNRMPNNQMLAHALDRISFK
jgi:hypothetical protein